MLRATLVIVLCAGVHLAALRAPLVHAHMDGHDAAHHGGRLVHAHLAGHVHADTPHGAVLDEGATRAAIFLDPFVAVRVAAPDAPAVAVASFDLIVPAEHACRRLLDVVHGHDPPLAFAGPSRAPPAFLS